MLDFLGLLPYFFIKIISIDKRGHYGENNDIDDLIFGLFVKNIGHFGRNNGRLNGNISNFGANNGHFGKKLSFW